MRIDLKKFEIGTRRLHTKQTLIICYQPICRPLLTGLGNHAQPLTNTRWRMNVIFTAWLSSSMSASRFCPRPRVYRTLHATRGMIIGLVNSAQVKHFVATRLLQNAVTVSSTVTHDTEEVPESQQTETPKTRRRNHAPPEHAALLRLWTDNPPQVSSIGRLIFNRPVDRSRSISTVDKDSPT